jgi:hypothetical protein
MTVSARVRKAGLTLHVASSVGWLGAVLVYLGLGVTAVTSDDTVLVAAVYLAMDRTAWTVLVPLALAAFVTGVAQALISSWGLWRHYWVVIKLVITTVATVVLVLYTGTLSGFAEVAGDTPLSAADVALLRSPSVIVHSTGALVLLATATVLAIHKPAGLTRHGHRHRHAARSARANG